MVVKLNIRYEVAYSNDLSKKKILEKNNYVMKLNKDNFFNCLIILSFHGVFMILIQ